ncbi:MAG TPA: hypothetical protein VJT31_20940 [Rugosimonospora sp.]|nr:hypothetical protein [Rugosimonospora sp.]
MEVTINGVTYDTKIIDGIECFLSGYPLPSNSGPLCGRCRVHHVSAKAVRMCYEVSAADEAQAEADYLHERYCERAWESRHSDVVAAELALEERMTGRPWWDTGHGEG